MERVISLSFAPVSMLAPSSVMPVREGALPGGNGGSDWESDIVRTRRCRCLEQRRKDEKGHPHSGRKISTWPVYWWRLRELGVGAGGAMGCYGWISTN